MGGFLPKSGGYRNLRVYKMTEIIYDLTVVFVKRFIEPGSRTKDQMVQAARSGKQNIAEGSEASKTSKETEIKLTNVARSSLEELRIDYEDYIRQNSLSKWEIGYRRLEMLREFLRSDDFMANPMALAYKLTAEEFCNLAITLINQAQSMLKALINRQEQQFLKNGGIREQMSAARRQWREENKWQQYKDKR